MSKKDIIDLEQDNEGVYSPKKVPALKNSRDTIAVVQKSNMDEFFEGMDLGMQFVEGVSKRINKLMKFKR